MVDAAFLQPRLQEAIAAWDDRVAVHLVLCAGPFPRLSARRPLIRPFDTAVAELTGRGLRSLELVIPFAAQANPAVRKWEAAGFACRAHVLGDKSADRPVARWLAERLAGTSADALVFDYVGFPAAILEKVGAEIELPVLDLGGTAMDALEKTLDSQ